jgi:hypothetical protein
MNDFSELEDQLRKLRPMQPSADLAERIERSLAEIDISRASVSDVGLRSLFRRWRSRFTEWSRGDASDIDGRIDRPSERERASQTPPKLSLALGLAAAAAVLMVLARLGVDQPTKKTAAVASMSPGSIAPSTGTPVEFVPTSLTRVVYKTRDEGLHFSAGSNQPMRRLRSQTRETLQWRNPQTGASLRVSYPSEEVSLIPVSGE